MRSQSETVLYTALKGMIISAASARMYTSDEIVQNSMSDLNNDFSNAFSVWEGVL